MKSETSVILLAAVRFGHVTVFYADCGFRSYPSRKRLSSAQSPTSFLVEHSLQLYVICLFIANYSQNIVVPVIHRLAVIKFVTSSRVLCSYTYGTL